MVRLCQESRNPLKKEVPLCNVYICMWRLTFNFLGTPILTSLDLSNVAGKSKKHMYLDTF